MPITTQRYVPDRGQVTVNTLQVEGSVKTISTAAPRKAERIVNSLGGSKTETQSRSKAGNYEITLEIFDDRSFADDDTGLLGVLWNAYETNIVLTGMAIAPAGSTIGMTEYTYGGSIHVVQCPPHGDMDADTEDDATVTAIIVVETITPAAIIA